MSSLFDLPLSGQAGVVGLPNARDAEVALRERHLQRMAHSMQLNNRIREAASRPAFSDAAEGYRRASQQQAGNLVGAGNALKAAGDAEARETIKGLDASTANLKDRFMKSRNIIDADIAELLEQYQIPISKGREYLTRYDEMSKEMGESKLRTSGLLSGFGNFIKWIVGMFSDDAAKWIDQTLGSQDPRYAQVSRTLVELSNSVDAAEANNASIQNHPLILKFNAQRAAAEGYETGLREIEGERAKFIAQAAANDAKSGIELRDKLYLAAFQTAQEGEQAGFKARLEDELKNLQMKRELTVKQYEQDRLDRRAALDADVEAAKLASADADRADRAAGRKFDQDQKTAEAEKKLTQTTANFGAFAIDALGGVGKESGDEKKAEIAKLKTNLQNAPPSFSTRFDDGKTQIDLFDLSRDAAAGAMQGEAGAWSPEQHANEYAKKLGFADYKAAMAQDGRLGENFKNTVLANYDVMLARLDAKMQPMISSQADPSGDGKKSGLPTDDVTMGRQAAGDRKKYLADWFDQKIIEESTPAPEGVPYYIADPKQSGRSTIGDLAVISKEAADVAAYAATVHPTPEVFQIRQSAEKLAGGEIPGEQAAKEWASLQKRVEQVGDVSRIEQATTRAGQRGEMSIIPPTPAEARGAATWQRMIRERLMTKQADQFGIMPKRGPALR